MNIIKDYVVNNRCYKAGEIMVPGGLMLHSIGVGQPSASVLVKNFNTPDISVCPHGFIDANDGDMHQTLPWNYKGWHCYKGKNGSGNNTHIGIEMCEPPQIKYTGNGAEFICTDEVAARVYVKRTYDSAVESFASLCKEFNLDPLKDGVIISHSEGYKRGIASNHGDPEHLWNGLNAGYTMDGFRKDVKSAMDNLSKPSKPPVTDKTEKNNSIKEDDLVAIAQNATYYNGKPIPSWVKEQKWYVDKVDGDRVIINKNEKGTNAINSAIHKKFLSVKTPSSFMVKVHIANLNMRTGPSTNYAKIGYIPVGAYTIVEVNGKWGRLKSKQNYNGRMVNAWIHLDYATKL